MIVLDSHIWIRRVYGDVCFTSWQLPLLEHRPRVKAEVRRGGKGSHCINSLRSIC